MKTIIVSDTVLAGVSYDDSLRGIYTLKEMQEEGNKIIVLTNDPDYSICQIGDNSIPSYRMSFQDYSNISRKDPGIDNKLKAFKHILQKDPNINLEETYFILDNITDGFIMGFYPENSYCLNDRIATSKRVKTERTLSKVLDKIR